MAAVTCARRGDARLSLGTIREHERPRGRGKAMRSTAATRKAHAGDAASGGERDDRESRDQTTPQRFAPLNAQLHARAFPNAQWSRTPLLLRSGADRASGNSSPVRLVGSVIAKDAALADRG
jgi:hypothetical protein